MIARCRSPAARASSNFARLQVEFRPTRRILPRGVIPNSAQKDKPCCSPQKIPTADSVQQKFFHRRVHCSRRKFFHRRVHRSRREFFHRRAHRSRRKFFCRRAHRSRRKFFCRRAHCSRRKFFHRRAHRSRRKFFCRRAHRSRRKFFLRKKKSPQVCLRANLRAKFFLSAIKFFRPARAHPAEVRSFLEPIFFLSPYQKFFRLRRARPLVEALSSFGYFV